MESGLEKYLGSICNNEDLRCKKEYLPARKIAVEMAIANARNEETRIYFMQSLETINKRMRRGQK